jgi:succinyl-CoA synthetase beta subunit
LAARTANLTRLATARVPLAAAQQCRFLNLHEFQSAEIMRKHGVTTPKGGVAKSAEEAYAIAKATGSNNLVIKAQVLAGGRGLGHFDNGFKGGVHVGVKTPEEIRDMAAKMIGFKLITKQTDAGGRICNTVAVVETVLSKDEKYFAILMDRAYGGPVIIASAQGGVTIEDIAHKNPAAIIKEPIGIMEGLKPGQSLEIAKKMKFSCEKATQQAAKNIEGLYQCFIKSDCTMVEVNPFTETVDGDIVCVDAKVNFDDNAAFRQKEIHALRDISQEDALDVQAAEHDLNFINLDGNIACLVNGAGLAMATMDIIKLCGGSPANFLDLGGSVTTPAVVAAFKILTLTLKSRASLLTSLEVSSTAQQ